LIAIVLLSTDFSTQPPVTADDISTIQGWVVNTLTGFQKNIGVPSSMALRWLSVLNEDQ
jgi:hypothetical protein